MVKALASTIKTQLGMARNRLNELLGGEIRTHQVVYQNDWTDVDKGEYLERLKITIRGDQDKVIKSIKRFQDLNTQWLDKIEGIEDDDAAEAREQKVYDDYMLVPANYAEPLHKGEDLLTRLNMEMEDAERRLRHITGADDDAGSSRARAHQAAATPRVTLPELKLIKFSGELSEWPVFWGTFSSTIHNNASLDNQMKINYLLAQLMGHASAVVKGFLPTGDNYSLVVDTLKQRYGNDERIRMSLFRHLRSLSSHRGNLEDLVVQIEQVLRQLEAMKESVDTPQTIMDIEGVLPNSELLRWLRVKDENPNWKLADLRKLLQSQVRIHENARLLKGEAKAQSTSKASSPHKNYPRGDRNDKPRPSPYDGSALVSTTPTNRFSKPCVFCKGKHWNTKCEKFSTARQRRRRLIELKLCSKCLKKDHDFRTCEIVKTCFHCQGKHYTFLCGEKFPEKDEKSDPKPAFSRRPKQKRAVTLVTADGGEDSGDEEGIVSDTGEDENADNPSSDDESGDEESEGVEASVMCHFSSEVPQAEQASVLATTNVESPIQSTLLMTKEVTVANPTTGKKTIALIIFDPCSTHSYVARRLANKLHLVSSREDKRAMGTFNSTDRTRRTLPIVKVCMPFLGAGELRFEAGVVEDITAKLCVGTVRDDSLPDYSSPSLDLDVGVKSPLMLLGADYLYNVVDYSSIVPLRSGFQLIKSKVGDLVTGPGLTASAEHELTLLTAVGETTLTLTAEDKEVEHMCMDFWQLEAIGVHDCPMTKDNETALKHFYDTYRYRKDIKRLIVQWPWKPNIHLLGDNFGLCLRRLESLWKWLQQRRPILVDYSKALQLQRDTKITRMVEKDDEPRGPVTYLPHRPHLTPTKTTTKVRPIIDGSARVKGGLSLNDCLYRGPVGVPEIAGVLLRCRTYYILLVGDIEKAFHQLMLAPESQDVTRFLWLHDPTKPPTKDNLMICCYERVPFGIISSPFELQEAAKVVIAMDKSPVAKELTQNMYVDNVFLGCNNSHEAQHKYKETKRIFARASMNIRNFLSNDEQANSLIPTEDRDSSSTISLLGLPWDTINDTLTIKIPTPNPEITDWTKRMVLQLIGKVYDPLGLLSPVTLPLKLFLQKLWIAKTEWDDPLNPGRMSEWRALIDWGQKEIVFPRRVTAVNRNEVGLHLYTDASKDGYGAVAYLRDNEAGPDGHEVSLLMAKTRVSPPPPKDISIPRLEMLGVLIGSRLMKFIVTHLSLRGPVYLWSDSECVLSQLKSTKEREVWVANRVRQIRNTALTELPLNDIYFGHVGGEDNPADIASRGATFKELLHEESSLWQKGAPWLRLDKKHWPECHQLHQEPEPVDEFAALLQVEERTPAKTPANMELLESISPSKLSSLLCIIGFVLRFIRLKLWDRLGENTKHLENHLWLKRLVGISPRGPLTTLDLELARLVAIKLAQSSHYVQQDLKKKRSQLDETDLIWVQHRLPEEEIAVGIKSRHLYLPRHGHITRLFIKDAHRKALHAGVSYTLAKIRDEFWLPRGRTVVRSVIDNCEGCQLWTAKQFELPLMAPQRKERVCRWTPFTYVGLDYLGPIKIKRRDDSIAKIWACIFTCYTTRLTHIEPVFDMTARGFCNALKRFVGRRGAPFKITCDNATQFKLTSRLIEASSFYNNHEVVEYSRLNRLHWHFIPPLSPWVGGIYERVVGLFKESFRRAINRSLVDLEVFITLIPEIESILNSRPLTYLDEDGSTPLRPIDFISPQARLQMDLVTEAVDDYVPRPNSRDELLKYYADTSRLADLCWKHFHDDYVKSMAEASAESHNPRSVTKREPIVGEVVIVQKTDAPRNHWRMGRIKDIHRADDGHVRKASVDVGGKVFVRSINQLCPLEVPRHSSQKTPPPVNQPHGENKDDSCTRSEPAHQTSSHRMVTRAKARAAAASIPIVLIICTLLSLEAVSAAKCPNGSPGLLVHHQSCMPRGIAVFKMKDANLCYRYVNCTVGHIKASAKLDDYCGRECPCPTWAKSCSHYTGVATRNSTVQGEETKALIINAFPSSVCALEPMGRCEPHPVQRTLKQIQLYDKTTHFIEEWRLVYREYVGDDFICVGKVNGTRTGSPAYCERNPDCKTAGTQFCYYPSNEAVFLQTDDGLVAIEAWGEVTVMAYGYLVRHSQPADCSNCTLKCMRGGVLVQGTSGVGPIQVCESDHFCYQIQRLRGEKHEFHFPAEVVSRSQDYWVQFYSNGYLIRHLTLECKPSPFCEMIVCWLCWERWQNYHCVDKTVACIILGAIYLLTTILYMCWKMGYKTVRGGYLILKAVLLPLLLIYRGTRVLWRKCSGLLIGQTGNTNPSGNAPRDFRLKQRRRRRSPTPPRSLLLGGSLATLIAIIHGCAEFQSITGTNENCLVRENGELSCTYTTAVNLHGQRGQKVCLLLKNHENRPLGQLEFTAPSVKLRCVPISRKFTRNIDIEFARVTRCYQAGSCDEDFCEGVRSNTTVPELGTEPFTYPGHTKCLRTGGDWGNWCFIPLKGCGFGRYYVKPRDQEVYEAFECVVWDPEITLRTSIALGNRSDDHEVVLHEKRTVKIHDIKITLQKVETPISSLITGKQHFLTNGRQTVLFDHLEDIRLHCRDRTAAKRFACSIPESVCRCGNQDPNIYCSCSSNLNLAELFDGTRLLPTSIGGFFFHRQGTDGVEAEILQGYYTLHLEMEGMKVAGKMDGATCQISNPSFDEGSCYNCFSGARLQLTATSSYGHPKAFVDCGDVHFSIEECSPEGIERVRVLYFQEGNVHRECTVETIGGNTTFTLEGQLNAVTVEQAPTIATELHEERPETDWGVHKIKQYARAMVDWVIAHYIELLLAAAGIAIVVGLIVLCVSLLPLLPQLLLFLPQIPSRGKSKST